MNHLYALPRFSLLPEHGHKGFIPYTHIFDKPGADAKAQAHHAFLQAQVTSLSPRSLTLSKSFPEYGVSEPEKKLDFDYLVYALGSHLPAPIDLWGPADVEQELKKPIQYDGTKAAGISWLKRFRSMIERVPSVLVVGGGALGIRKMFAQSTIQSADLLQNMRPILLRCSRTSA
jgi:apoptosis-inducing factor 2